MKKNTLLFILAVVACSCREPRVSTEKLIAGSFDSLSSCPFITTDHEGNPVISYVRDLNDSVSVMCYRTSYDNGESFSQPVDISPSRNITPHGENLPKIVFKPNNEIIAVWGSSQPHPENKYAGQVSYAQSFDAGKTWTAARALVTDQQSYDQRYFDIVILPNGEAGLIWLDNREETEQEGSSIFFTSTKNKQGFVGETRIAESICPCCRTELFADKKGQLHACFRDIIHDSIRDMVHVMSSDGGKTFSQPQRISADNWVINGCPHTGPSMTRNKQGLHFTWYSGAAPGGVFYCKLEDKARRFSQRDSVSTEPSAKHPQMATGDEEELLITWDESVKFKDTYNARIGFQQRDENGKIRFIKYITADSLVCEYPVILPLKNKKALIAYSKKTGDHKTVCYSVENYEAVR